ncbi:aminotransferase-like domain-containing protein [Rhodococcus sp. NPDC003382]|uniref:aminotransferase-like domain-containing protein n=1 Tax=Rhodococcus sp. CX TaxID=2789880 RepID=UPI0018CD7382|nr:PLP-dependent aminotransferase family protein [Rhodococcus sp. CX]MBH0118226.1 PLP-dependent aminotransferase family protein [Rhodococcus sp. CX]
MDQDTVWWTTVVFGPDDHTDLPRYQWIVAAIEQAIDARTVTYGQRLPAERTLAAALCVSRGTVVRAFEELTERGVVERIHGSGTFVRPRPGTPRPIIRHIDSPTEDIGDVIDLSEPAPADASHLPVIDWGFDPTLCNAGVPARGLPILRHALATHLTCLGLPTEADQILVTTGAAEALDLVLRATSAAKRPAVVGAPLWPALRSVVAEHTATSLCLHPDAGGIDPAAVRRALRRTRAAIVFADVVESGPSGRSTASSRLPRIAAAIEDHTALAIEDLSFLPLAATRDPQARPLAALSARVTAIGDLDRVFWAGCGIGWVRTSAPDASLITASPRIPAPAVSAQVHAARLLDAASPQWFADRYTQLAQQAAHLRAALAELVPSWTVEPATTGDGLWIRLPVVDASTFAHVAARGGVRVAVGRDCVTDGGLREYIRLSAAADTTVLDTAVDRLVEAWATYTRRLAASV